MDLILELEEGSNTRAKHSKCVLLSLFIVVIIVSSSITYVVATGSLLQTTIQSGSMVSGYSSIIFTDGFTYYARNGFTGAIEYSGVAAHTIINMVLANDELIKCIGTFDLLSYIDFSGLQNITFDCTQARFLQHNTDMIRFSQSNGSSPAMYITIRGGIFVGDNSVHDAFWGKGGVSNIDIDGIIVSNIGTGLQQAIYLRGSYVTVEHSTFRNINGVPVLLGRDEAETFSVTNNKIVYNTILSDAVQVEDSLAFDQCVNSWIENNYIVNHGQINCYGNVKNIYLQNNLISGCKYGIVLNIDALNRLGEDIHINYNSLNSTNIASSQGIYLGGNSQYHPQRLSVIGNSVRGFNTGINLFYSNATQCFLNRLSVCLTGIDQTGATNQDVDHNYIV